MKRANKCYVEKNKQIKIRQDFYSSKSRFYSETLTIPK